MRSKALVQILLPGLNKMKLKINVKGKEYNVEILEEESGKTKIHLGGNEFIFGGKKEGEISVPKVSIPKRDFSKKEIKAPIAGRITEVFVKENEFVKKDQKILIISSMKMENEIIADFEGKVKEILAKKGQEVKGGDILVVLS